MLFLHPVLNYSMYPIKVHSPVAHCNIIMRWGYGGQVEHDIDLFLVVIYWHASGSYC